MFLNRLHGSYSFHNAEVADLNLHRSIFLRPIVTKLIWCFVVIFVKHVFEKFTYLERMTLNKQVSGYFNNSRASNPILIIEAIESNLGLQFSEINKINKINEISYNSLCLWRSSLGNTEFGSTRKNYVFFCFCFCF